MLKIITAGAGHGGLCAAAKLAKAGFDVELHEKKKREELGHDWEDRFSFDILKETVELGELPDDIWRRRGDCTFISPDYKTNIDIHFTEQTRHKIMWRKPVINMLLDYAEKCGVRLFFESEVSAPVTDGKAVKGVIIGGEEKLCDLVIDSAGVYSPVRTNLPDSFHIEKTPERGDVFYAYRAYFDKADKDADTGIPFKVFLCHSGEQGLSWCCAINNDIDILIGRIDPLDDELLERHLNKFRSDYNWIGTNVLHGGSKGIIPVRRPLALMTAEGYAAVGDSAFMTTPMNGMGIDLSLLAGKLLAETVIKNGSASAESLWDYNRDYHVLYGAETAKNEGLKNSLLNLPPEGVNFLFENDVIQSGDLEGAGRNMNVKVLLGKFTRGMRNPPYFFKLLGGITAGTKVSNTLRNAPKKYSEADVRSWQDKVLSHVLKVTR